MPEESKNIEKKNSKLKKNGVPENKAIQFTLYIIIGIFLLLLIWMALGAYSVRIG